MFCTRDSNLCDPNVIDVQMISGWMMDVIFFGRRAPKVKVVNVVNSIKRVWIGVLRSCDIVEKDAKTVAAPVRNVPVSNLWKVSSENAFGGGALLFAGVDAVVDGVEGCVSLDGNKARIPVTEYAVENKVKKNPITITPATFNNYS